MLTPTDLIMIFLFSKPLFVAFCILIVVTRREEPEPEPARRLTGRPMAKLLAYEPRGEER